MYKKHDTKILVSCFLYMEYGLIESQKQSGIKIAGKARVENQRS